MAVMYGSVRATRAISPSTVLMTPRGRGDCERLCGRLCLLSALTGINNMEGLRRAHYIEAGETVQMRACFLLESEAR